MYHGSREMSDLSRPRTTIETAALGIPGLHGDALASDGPHPERETFDQVVLRGRLRAALVSGAARVYHEVDSRKDAP